VPSLVFDTALATVLLVVAGLAFAAAIRWRIGRAAVLVLGWALLQHTIETIVSSDIPEALGIGSGMVAGARLILYFIAAPWAVLLELVVGRGWKSSIRLTWIVFLVSGVLAVGWDLSTGRFGSAAPVLTYVNAAGAFVGLLNLFWTGAGTPASLAPLRAGFLVFLVLVVHDALVRAGLLPWTTYSGRVGVLVFVASLAYTVVTRTLRGQQELLALEHELTTARRIQSALLPTSAPEIGGAAIAFRYVPAAAVAGDLFEFVGTTPRGTGILVADVSGHGVPAALIASMVKVAAAAQKPHADEPGQVLAGVHLALAQELPTPHFVTAIYAHLDLDRGTLRYASAGHPPPVIWNVARGTFPDAGANGPMIISFAPAEYPVHEIPIASGDRIVFYTDGLVEAMRSDDEMFGLERLQAVVGSSKNGADTLAAQLIDAAAAFSGRRDTGFEDDCTVVTIEITRLS
jgi:serine phosphatase RsbU (regulator of sigma subunit)